VVAIIEQIDEYLLSSFISSTSRPSKLVSTQVGSVAIMAAQFTSVIVLAIVVAAEQATIESKVAVAIKHTIANAILSIARAATTAAVTGEQPTIAVDNC
jgi:hypothetical protein